MSIDPREREYFTRMKALLEEQEALKADLAELKAEAEKKGGLTKERVGDLLAVAKLEVMDQAKRAKKDEQARRRAELEGQLSMLPEEPKKRALAEGRSKIDKAQTVTQATVAALETINALDALKATPEPPHDPETGEVIEYRGPIESLTPHIGDEGDLAEGACRGVPYTEPDLAAARRADFADDLEIPPYCDRRHEARRVPEAAE